MKDAEAPLKLEHSQEANSTEPSIIPLSSKTLVYLRIPPRNTFVFNLHLRRGSHYVLAGLELIRLLLRLQEQLLHCTTVLRIVLILCVLVEVTELY